MKLMPYSSGSGSNECTSAAPGGEGLDELRASAHNIGAKALEKISSAVTPEASATYNKAARQVNGQ